MPSLASLQCSWPLAVAFVVGSCGARDAPAAASATRDTLPDGTVRVRYASLPVPAVAPLEPSLSIGVVEGEPHEIFGNVRGIEADGDGTLYVLDYQASEVRAFSADGRFLRLVATRGQGPGELTEANGLVRGADGTLWIQDHGQWQMIGISLDGEEVARFPMHVRSYGFIYNGALDARGRFWKPTSHSDEARVFPPETGLNEGRSRSYLNWYDPATERSDSVFLGELDYRTYISQNSRGGYSYGGIPFTQRTITIVDPAGGFWTTSAEAYRIARLDEHADTVLVLEVDVEPLPVTEEDRESYVEGVLERSPDQRRAAEAIIALAPATKPVLDQLVMDDVGRLWVRRVVSEGETPLYDVFTRDAEYVGSARLGFQPAPYFPPKIRDGRLYTLVLDSLEVQSVVRVDLSSDLRVELP